MKKMLFSLMFLSIITTLCGCTTTRNATVGAAGYTYLVGKGACQDTKDTWKAINDLDAWMEKNLW